MRLCCPQPSVAHDGEGRRTDPQYPIDGLLRAEIVRLVRTGRRRVVYAALKPKVAAPKFTPVALVQSHWNGKLVAASDIDNHVPNLASGAFVVSGVFVGSSVAEADQTVDENELAISF